MTIENETTRRNYEGDGGGTDTFTFDIKAFSGDDIKVVERVNGVDTNRTDITVTMNANQDAQPGGSVEFATAPVLGAVGVIYRDVDITQVADYTPYDKFPALTHEAALDRNIMISQQINEVAGRALVTDFIDGEQVTVPSYVPGAYVRWSESETNVLETGWTESIMDLRFSPMVHGHTISDVTSLQGTLDSKVDQTSYDSDQSDVADTIADMEAAKADRTEVVTLTGDQTVGGTKTLSAVPICAIAATAASHLANKTYVDSVYNSLAGVIFKGSIDVSAGDGALPGSPTNGDYYLIGAGGTITVSDGSGPETSQPVAEGGQLIWSEPNDYWLYLNPLVGVAASAVTFNDIGNNHVTGNSVQAALDAADAALTDTVPASGGSFSGGVGLLDGATLENNRPLTGKTADGLTYPWLLIMNVLDQVWLGTAQYETYLNGAEVALHRQDAKKVELTATGIAVTGVATASVKGTDADDLQRRDQVVPVDESVKLSAGHLHTLESAVVDSDTVMTLDPTAGSLQTAISNASEFTFTLTEGAAATDAWGVDILLYCLQATTIVSRAGAGELNLWVAGGITNLPPGRHLLSVRKLQSETSPPELVVSHTQLTLAATS